MMFKFRQVLIIALSLSCLYSHAFAAKVEKNTESIVTDSAVADSVKKGRDTGFPLPRFASVRPAKAFIRSGPGIRYPIEWVLEEAGLPVEITNEYDAWRKIRAPNGEEGWIHHSLLSGRRSIFTKGTDMVQIHDKPKDRAAVIALVEPKVVGRIKECDANWCDVLLQGYRGWIKRDAVWGLYPHEEEVQ